MSSKRRRKNGKNKSGSDVQPATEASSADNRSAELAGAASGKSSGRVRGPKQTKNQPLKGAAMDNNPLTAGLPDF